MTTTESCPVYTYDKCDTCQTTQMHKMFELFVHVEATYTCSKHYTWVPHIAHSHVARYLRFNKQSRKNSPTAPAWIGFWTSNLPTTLFVTELCLFVTRHSQMFCLANSTMFPRSNNLPCSMNNIQSIWLQWTCSSYTNTSLWSVSSKHPIISIPARATRC